MPLFGRATTPDAAPPPPEPIRADDVTMPNDVDEYRDALLAQVRSLRPFGIGLHEACGLTLCESIGSDLDLPVFTAATVEGWAVRASNLVGAAPNHPIVLPLVGHSGMSDQFATPLSAGTTVHVDAGAPVPEGADAVVPVDKADDTPEAVRFTSEAAFHDFLRPAGSRVADGDALLPSGTVLDPRMIAMLAEVGLDKVLARPKPRVVVATVGADLVEPGFPLTRLTQTYDCATAMIAAAAREAGAQAFPIGVVGSDVVSLRQVLSEQLVRADLLIVTTSETGPLVRALAALGTVHATQVDMAPGGHIVFGRVGVEHVPVIGLPGGVVPTYVAYEVFARPLIRSLAGQEPLDRKVVDEPVAEPLPYDANRTQFVLGVYGKRGVAPIPLAPDAGGVELAYANALIVVPAGVRVEVGDTATCWPLN